MKKLKVKISKIFTGIFVFVAFTLTISLADLFSSLITVGGFTFTSDNLSLPQFTLYAVSTSSSDNKIIADEQAESCRKLGGAGYVYMTDSAYIIIASIYTTKADAESVKSNLIATKPNTTILEIKIPNITINGNLSTEEKEVIMNALGIFKNTYKKLYDISVSLDTSIITEINAKLNINQLCGEVNTVVNNFATMFKNSHLTDFIEVEKKLQELQTALNNLVDATATIPLTSHIKNTYCKAVFLYKNLAESLEN